jgi:hypothetical protein
MLCVARARGAFARNRSPLTKRISSMPVATQPSIGNRLARLAIGATGIPNLPNAPINIANKSDVLMSPFLHSHDRPQSHFIVPVTSAAATAALYACDPHLFASDTPTFRVQTKEQRAVQAAADQCIAPTQARQV